MGDDSADSILPEILNELDMIIEDTYDGNDFERGRLEGLKEAKAIISQYARDLGLVLS